MSVPILGLSIGYTYHPVIPNPKYNVPREEPLKWQPWEMEPDMITLELEAGPAALRLYGSVLKVLAAIKVMQQCATIYQMTIKTKSFSILYNSRSCENTPGSTPV